MKTALLLMDIQNDYFPGRQDGIERPSCGALKACGQALPSGKVIAILAAEPAL